MLAGLSPLSLTAPCAETVCTLPALPDDAVWAAVRSASFPAEAWAERAQRTLGRGDFVTALSAAYDSQPDGAARQLLQAETLIAAGYLEEGEAELAALAAAALDPRVRHRAWLRLGEARMRRGAGRDAAVAFARAREVPGEEHSDGSVLLWEGSALAMAGDGVRAAELLEAAARQAGATPAARHGDAASARAVQRLALRYAGWLRAAQGQFPAARELWREARERAQDETALADSLTLDIAESFGAEGAWDSVAAVLSCEPATGAARRGDPRREFLTGRALVAQARFDEAETALARVLAAPERVPQATVDDARLLRGSIALRRGDASAAVADFRQVSPERTRGQPLVRYAAALAYINQRNLAAAESTLAAGPTLTEEDPLFRPWAYALAYVRFHQAHYAASLEALRGVTEGAPGDSLARAAHVLRGDACYRLGEMSAAAAAYARAAAHATPPPEALLRRQALAALGAGQWGAAARILGDLSLKFPGTSQAAEYAFWRGEAFYRLGHLDSAREHYLRAEGLGADAAACAYALGTCDEDEGRDTEAALQFARAQAQAGGRAFAADLMQRYARCLRRLGRRDEAEALLAGATRIAAGAVTIAVPGEPPGPAQLQPTREPVADSAWEEAQRDFRDGLYEAALARYRELQGSLCPSDRRCLELRLQIARCREGLGEPGAALAEYVALGEMEGTPERAEALLRAGVLYLRLSQPRRALEMLTRRLNLDLDPVATALTRTHLAGIYEILGQTQAANNEWEKVASEASGAPDSLRAQASLGLARAAFAAGEWGAACAGFVAADSLGSIAPGDRARYWAGEAAFRLGRPAAAARSLEIFLRRGEADAYWESAARLRLGECYMALGRSADARLQYEQVIASPLADESLRREARRRLAGETPTDAQSR